MTYSHETFLIQTGLEKLGFSPGAIDGLRGRKTNFAFAQFVASKQKKQLLEKVSKLQAPSPTTAAKRRVFGTEGKIEIATFTPPYAMEFSWDGRTVGKIGCHKLIKTPLENALKELLNTFGYEWIVEHGLHLYAGCFNYRRSRGGRSLSDHAWAIAIDLNPDANGLSTTWNDGKSASNGTKQMPKAAVEIFRKHGFQVGFPRSNGTRRDMMHVAYVNRA